jgi:hypothetical protein
MTEPGREQIAEPKAARSEHDRAAHAGEQPAAGQRLRTDAAAGGLAGRAVHAGPCARRASTPNWTILTAEYRVDGLRGMSGLIRQRLNMRTPNHDRIYRLEAADGRKTDRQSRRLAPTRPRYRAATVRLPSLRHAGDTDIVARWCACPTAAGCWWASTNTKSNRCARTYAVRRWRVSASCCWLSLRRRLSDHARRTAPGGNHAACGAADHGWRPAASHSGARHKQTNSTACRRP